ncbi:MAG: SUMF1/EgtB/PvdO family nonheme iron enzyme, partial [Mariniblastus sp.]|nr:SUMF1/EgtB/PvdO family nonheme iron enzyme [Mariniblastus sp.]
KKPPRIRSFYEILGVAPDADEAEIRQGYRRAVQDHHPDHNPDDRRSAKRIRHLNAARDTLLAPDLRKIYDAKLRKRGMLPDQPGEGEPASEASTANSDETRFATDTDIPDLEPAPSAGFYSHSFQIESEPQPDYGQAASNPRQRTTSRRKRESRAKFLITLVMVPLGGIAGVSVAILLLWVGFSQDPFGLFQADAKPVAQTVSDTTPSEGPTPLAGDPAPPSTFLTPPANEPNNPSKEPAVPWDNPTEPTTPPRHGSSTESTAGNAFGKRFAKLEFPTPPQFASLAVGTPIHSDRDSVWSKVPTKLDGLQATQWECLKGRADVNVTSPGYVLMAVSPRWGRGGGKDGKWEKELVTEQELLRDGWKYLDTIYEATDQPEKSLPWSVYGKDFTASEPLRIRTEKYLAPRFFFPVSKTPPGEKKAAGPPRPTDAPFDADTAKAHQQAWAEYLGLPVEFENSIGMKMRLIPPGQFMMGSGNGQPSERPVHTVVLTRPYYVSVYEVTQKEYEQVTGKNPSRWIDGKNPVEQVNWSEATQFCQQLSKVTAEQQIGRRYQLPTEAEWEYACRAGTTTPYNFGSDSADLNDHAWHLANSGKQPHPVGQKKPNAWGLFDMHGNVWEWCRDGFDKYTTSRKTDPTGSTSVKRGRVFRGFSCVQTSVECRSSFRGGLDPKLRYDSGGFRVVLAIPDEYFKSPGNRTSNSVNENNTPREDSGGIAQTPKKDEWVALFNGKTLDGWQGNHCWKIVNNTIVGECSKGNGTKLVSQKTYDDFELQFKFKLDYGNSGLFFRNYRTNDGTIVPFQAEIGFIPNLPMNKGRDFLTGCVNAELKVKHPEHFTADMRENLKKVVQDSINNNEWTKYEISAQGSRIRVRVNGILTVDFHNPKIVDRGKLELQLHGGGTRVWFKDILVKER